MIDKNPKIGYTSGEIKKAGKSLMNNNEDKNALKILAYFRNDHIKPLNKAYSLIQKILHTEKDVLIAKRLKRTPSIISKLINQKDKNTQLSTIQDIGGCRVVLNTLRNVKKFVHSIQKEGTFILKDDYINNPKENGYKSIHLIGKFDNDYGKDRKIELQVRTNIQHSWATAVEIVDLFRKESIKSGNGSKDWMNFFSLVAKQFDILEKNPYLNSDNEKLLREYFRKEIQNSKTDELYLAVFSLFTLSKKLDVYTKFSSYRDSIKVMAEALTEKKDGYFLISIEFITNETIIKTSHFSNNELDKANEEYLKLEEISIINKNYVCALISTLSIGGIKKAYPNYFADSTKFIEYLELFNNNFKENKEMQRYIQLILSQVMAEKESLLNYNISRSSLLNNIVIENFSEIPTDERNIYNTTHLDKLLK